MEIRENKNKLILSALRAHIGDWVYYLSFMKMKDIAKIIAPAHSLYTSKTLHDLLQRRLTKGRAVDISTYLNTQEQRFFNALVIGTYGGDPQWHELEITEKYTLTEKIPSHLDGTLGFLTLDGTEKLFAIDGQHRVEGIRIAVKDNPSLGDDEVSIILIRGITGEGRQSDPEGFERTRRLFTTLNRYAKPVNKKDIIALDEDDTIAIITRKLVEEYPLFMGEKTSIKGSTSIPKNDYTSFTSINALYDGLDIYFKKANGWTNFKRFNPGEPVVLEYYTNSVNLWDTFCRYFTPLNELKNSDTPEKVTIKYRNSEGGHLLFRPIGLLMSLKAVRNLIDHRNLSLEQAIERLSLAEMSLNAPHWTYLIWNPSNNKMITASANRKAAEKILVYSIGGDLRAYNTNLATLREDIAAIQDKEPSEVTIPNPIIV